jgi:hypothetical protein
MDAIVEEHEIEGPEGETTFVLGPPIPTRLDRRTYSYGSEKALSSDGEWSVHRDSQHEEQDDERPQLLDVEECEWEWDLRLGPIEPRPSVMADGVFSTRKQVFHRRNTEIRRRL